MSSSGDSGLGHHQYDDGQYDDGHDPRGEIARLTRLLREDIDRLGPSLPSYHWHSVVQRRGWEQRTLDGRNGGEDPDAWLWRHTDHQRRRHPEDQAPPTGGASPNPPGPAR